MKHLLLALLLLHSLLCSEELDELILSTPQQIASTTYNADTLIGGLISPLSGMLILSVTNLVVQGAQPITLSRTYFSPYMPVEFAHEKQHNGEYEKKYLQAYLAKNYKGWQYLPHILLEYFPNTKQVRVADASGITLDFQLENGKTLLLSTPYAISNTSGEKPSGKFDVRNTRILYQEDTIIVKSCDGVERHYKLRRTLKERMIYFLHKELLINGKCLKYEYDELTRIRITAQDREERFTYASVLIDSTKRDGSVQFTSSSGKEALYRYTQQPLDWHIKGKAKKGKFDEKGKGRTPLLLTSVKSPFYAFEWLSYCSRALLAEYRGKDLQFGLHHDGFGEERHYRVDQLFLPVGAQDAFIPAYTLDYQPAIPGQKEGKTTVKRLDGITTHYHFSKNLLLTSIQIFEREILKQEKLFPGRRTTI